MTSLTPTQVVVTGGARTVGIGPTAVLTTEIPSTSEADRYQPTLGSALRLGDVCRDLGRPDGFRRAHTSIATLLQRFDLRTDLSPTLVGFKNP